jgi:hypothetical protein
VVVVPTSLVRGERQGGSDGVEGKRMWRRGCINVMSQM